MPFAPSIYPVKITATRPDGLTTVLNTTMTVEGSTDDVSFYLGYAAETNTALPVAQLGGDVTVELGIAVSTESANDIIPTLADDIDVDLGVATETNIALHVVTTPDVLGVATETGTGLNVVPFIAPQIQVVLGRATETDGALSVTPQTTEAVQAVLGVATETDTALDVQPLITSDQAISVSVTLVTRSGSLVSGQSSLSWAWFDSVDPANLSTPVAKGQEETTNAQGVLELQIQGSSLTSGQRGLLVLRSDDGSSIGAYNLEVA